MKRLLDAITNLSSRRGKLGNRPKKASPRQVPSYNVDPFKPAGSGVEFGGNMGGGGRKFPNSAAKSTSNR